MRATGVPGSEDATERTRGRPSPPPPPPADGEHSGPGGRGTRTARRGEKTWRGRSWPRSWARRVLKSKCLRLRPCPAHTSDPGKGRSGRLGSGEPRTLHTGAPGIRAGARPAKTSPYTDRQVRGPRGPGGGLAVSDAVRVAAALRWSLRKRHGNVSSEASRQASSSTRDWQPPGAAGSHLPSWTNKPHRIRPRPPTPASRRDARRTRMPPADTGFGEGSGWGSVRWACRANTAPS